MNVMIFSDVKIARLNVHQQQRSGQLNESGKTSFNGCCDMTCLIVFFFSPLTHTVIAVNQGKFSSTLTQGWEGVRHSNHKLTQIVHGPGQEGFRASGYNQPEQHWSTKRQRHRWSEMSAQSLKHIRRESPTQPQSVHPAAIWQKIQKYLLTYHQTTVQLPALGRTPSINLSHPTERYVFHFYDSLLHHQFIAFFIVKETATIISLCGSGCVMTIKLILNLELFEIFTHGKWSNKYLYHCVVDRNVLIQMFRKILDDSEIPNKRHFIFTFSKITRPLSKINAWLHLRWKYFFK